MDPVFVSGYGAPLPGAVAYDEYSETFSSSSSPNGFKSLSRTFGIFGLSPCALTPVLSVPLGPDREFGYVGLNVIFDGGAHTNDRFVWGCAILDAHT